MSNKTSAQAGQVAAVPRDTTPPPKDHFSALPPELRLMIYDHCAVNYFCSGKPIVYPTRIDNPKSHYDNWDEETHIESDSPYYCKTLLSVSRQTREEVAPVYYGQNIFSALINLEIENPAVDNPNMKIVRNWLSDRGQENAKLVKDLHLYFQLGKDEEFHADATCQGHHVWSSEFRVRNIGTMKGFLEVMGLSESGLRPIWASWKMDCS